MGYVLNEFGLFHNRGTDQNKSVPGDPVAGYVHICIRICVCICVCICICICISICICTCIRTCIRII